MTNSKIQVMCCGACAVRMDENGQTTTTIDALANGVRNLFSKVSKHHAADAIARVHA